MKNERKYHCIKYVYADEQEFTNNFQSDIADLSDEINPDGVNLVQLVSVSILPAVEMHPMLNKPVSKLHVFYTMLLIEYV